MIRPPTLPALWAGLALLAAACGDAPSTAASRASASGPAGRPAPDSAAVVPYTLTAPAAVVELPDELREISGLTVLESGRLGAVQDESGTLYELDAATGAVLSREAFDARGDYEGVEQAGDDVWVLQSNGDLTRLRRGAEAEVFETALAGRNDTEGLAYDAAGNRLLIACKENPGNGLGDVRAVYAFDLASETLSAAPVFTMDRTRLDAEDPFKPSAIAVRPGTGEAYVLSSVRRALAVVRADGTLLAVVELPEALYPQPEGIAFAPDGTLYISNEGPDGPDTLLRFDPTR
jgi:uncharacterized protein YjiK